MTPTRVIGLLALLIGVILQPIGWMYTHWLTVVSFISIAAGVFLFFVGRQDLADSGRSEPRTGERGMPGDIYGHSGQMSGGRSTAWESHHSNGEAGHGDWAHKGIVTTGT